MNSIATAADMKLKQLIGWATGWLAVIYSVYIQHGVNKFG